ncbi:MAG TPA: sulfite exporter TauE/SafE family protein [Blastocatellia bacterium]|nr:sulfite exporter TauE/SafE family protein [Blastocatellia bacterium]
MTPLHSLLIFVAGFIGGMMNSIAGGGTLITFPLLVWHGLSPINANATNTFALWPGSLGGAWGYRHELKKSERPFFVLIIPSLLGGLLGAILLRLTPEQVFARMVPFLILFATLLFMVQGPVQRWLRRKQNAGGQAGQHQPQNPVISGKWLIGASFFQLLAATYGGYFGAGMGIVMLANLGLIGMTDIHQMNGLKNIFGSIINFVAAMYFIRAGLVNWPEAVVMMAGAIIGGYSSAGVARRMGREFARRAVIVIGFVLAGLLLVRR